MTNLNRFVTISCIINYDKYYDIETHFSHIKETMIINKIIYTINYRKVLVLAHFLTKPYIIYKIFINT